MVEIDLYIYIYIYIFFFFYFIDACGFVWLLRKSRKRNENYGFDGLWVVVGCRFFGDGEWWVVRVDIRIDKERERERERERRGIERNQ